MSVGTLKLRYGRRGVKEMEGERETDRETRREKDILVYIIALVVLLLWGRVKQP